MNKPKRFGADFFPNSFGISLIISKGTFFEDYSHETKITYLDIRLLLVCFQLFVQIPIKKYGKLTVIK